MRSSPPTALLFLEAIARYRRMILGMVLTATCLAIIVSLLLPKWYKATALLLPPKTSSLVSAEYRGISEVSAITEGMALPLMVTPSDVYARMLKSRKIADSIIARFQLERVFETDSREATYRALMEKSEFRVTEEGLLTVSAEHRHPDTAAMMANAFVSQLDATLRSLASEQNSQSRSLLERRLVDVKRELDSSRMELQKFQLTHRTVDFDQQTRLAVEQAISLKASLSAIETELMVRERTLGRDNAELADLRQRKKIVERQLKDLETINRDSSFFSLAISDIPALRGRYEELYSRMRINESLYNLLIEQLERAKIHENNDVMTVSVVDPATPPELRSRPKRTIIVLSTFLVSLALALALAGIAEYVRRLRYENPDEYLRVAGLAESCLGWLPGVKRSPERHEREYGA